MVRKKFTNILQKSLKPANFFDQDLFIKLIAMAFLILYLSHNGHALKNSAECCKTLSVFSSPPSKIKWTLVAYANEELAAGGARCQAGQGNGARFVG